MGSFLKWKLKGEILAAVGRDVDNIIYLIAWAVVRVEDNESWAWFVDHLKKGLGLALGGDLTVISDKQKGLLNAVKDMFPQAQVVRMLATTYVRVSTEQSEKRGRNL